MWFGLLRVRSPLLAESFVYFLLLWVMRCFSSPRSPRICGTKPSTWWVAPFGNLWIKGYLLLPTAYRSLSRPSSPPRATGIRRAPFLSSSYLFIAIRLKSRLQKRYRLCSLASRNALASHRCTRTCSDNALALFSVTTCQRSSLIPLRVEIVVR